MIESDYKMVEQYSDKIEYTLKYTIRYKIHMHAIKEEMFLRSVNMDMLTLNSIVSSTRSMLLPGPKTGGGDL